jgi:pyruvate formate lyase activating enzyme
LKGCQMRCPWCHNPETYRLQPDIQVFPDRCIACGACAEACRQAAHQFTDNSHRYYRERCVACGECVSTCFAKSLVRVGETREAASVVSEVLADRAFYHPAGGVTISGGEPLMQANFAGEILDLCRHEGIHTAIETNLAWRWEIVAPLVHLVDLFLVDIKIMNDAQHRAWTGISNERTLSNLRQLDSLNKQLVIRTPVVVGVNAGPEQIEEIADFLTQLHNVQQYELLPYHPLGVGKHHALGLNVSPSRFRTPTAEELDSLRQRAARANFIVKVAGKLPAIASNCVEPPIKETVPDVQRNKP